MVNSPGFLSSTEFLPPSKMPAMMAADRRFRAMELVLASNRSWTTRQLEHLHALISATMAKHLAFQTVTKSNPELLQAKLIHDSQHDSGVYRFAMQKLTAKEPDVNIDDLQPFAEKYSPTGAITQPVTSIPELYMLCDKVKPVFDKRMQDIVDEFGEDGVRLKLSPLKHLSRTIEKAAVSISFPNGENVLDIVRCLFICESLQQIIALVAQFDSLSGTGGDGGFEIVRIKNRFAKPSAAGWRDVMLGLAFSIDGLR